MEVGTIILRTIFMYFFLLFILRFMGKREIGQLSVLDFVVSIMIAELAVISIDNTDTLLLHSILPITILACIQIFLAYISLKSVKIREIVDGKPAILISRGKIDEKEMKRQRYNFHDLQMQLRQNNVRTIDDVEFAILEPSGELSVIEKRDGESIEMPFPLILDGKIQHEHLEKIHKTEFWLRQQLRSLGYRDIKKISYCSLIGDNNFFIDEKDEK